MPISSKKIIEYINGFGDSPFSLEDLITMAVTRSARKAKTEKFSPKTTRDIRIIHEVFSDLSRIGYLEPIKRTFRVSPSFPRSGTLSIIKGTGEVELGPLRVCIKPENMAEAHNGDMVDVFITEIRKRTVFGRIAKIVQKSRDRYLAKVETKTKGLVIFRLIDISGENFTAMERFPDEPAVGDYVSVKILPRRIGGRPACEILEHFESGSDEFDIDRIIMRHNLPGAHKEYPEYTDIDKSISRQEMKNRRDFTSLLTVTIDGEHAKDFDDAVSFDKDAQGYTLYVHIADVSAYVMKNSALDTEALRRGTSYYLGYRVIPMLPEVLSNNLCSLRPHEQRLTLTAIMRYSPEGSLLSYEFTRGIIRSFKRLTYECANTLIDNPDGTDLSIMLSNLHAFTVLLKKNRLAMGRIDLQINDFELCFENGHFEDIIRAPRFKSHSLIEEAMLSANEAVSRALREADIPTLYRVHEPMSDDQISSLRAFLRTLGVRLTDVKNLGRSIQSIVDTVAGKEYSHVINFVILRSMMQAFYGEQPLGHFGLGFKDYTHFTSPIRRYPDLIVHRCLKSLIDGTPPPYTSEELTTIGFESSRLERISQKAERDLFKIKSCRLMEDRIGESFDAVISGVSKYGIYVTLSDTPIEGMVPLRYITDDFYVVIEDEFRAVGRRYGKTYTLGDRVRVRLSRVDISVLQIDFEFIHTRGASDETGRGKKTDKSGKGNRRRFYSKK
jgi:ribonuclease R